MQFLMVHPALNDLVRTLLANDTLVKKLLAAKVLTTAHDDTNIKAACKERWARHLS